MWEKKIVCVLRHLRSIRNTTGGHAHREGTRMNRVGIREGISREPDVLLLVQTFPW